jgi:transcriptional regulator with XRE-family HTH domain
MAQRKGVIRVVSQPSSPLGECRLAAGYTQESFAEKLGVDRSTIGRWERGTQFPQPWQRPDLATALDMTLEELDDLLRRTKQRHTRAVAGTTNAGFGPLTRSSADNGPRHDHNLTGRADSDQADQAVQAGIPRLRRALDCIDMPEDGPTPPLGDLRLEAMRIHHQPRQRDIPAAPDNTRPRHYQTAWLLNHPPHLIFLHAAAFNPQTTPPGQAGRPPLVRSTHLRCVRMYQAAGVHLSGPAAGWAGLGLAGGRRTRSCHFTLNRLSPILQGAPSSLASQQ